MRLDIRRFVLFIYSLKNSVMYIGYMVVLAVLEVFNSPVTSHWFNPLYRRCRRPTKGEGPTAQKYLTLMLLVANLVKRKWFENIKKLKPRHMGTHLRLLRKSYPMNTNMTGFRWFSFSWILVLRKKVSLALEGLSKKKTTLIVIVVTVDVRSFLF